MVPCSSLGFVLLSHQDTLATINATIPNNNALTKYCNAKGQ